MGPNNKNNNMKKYQHVLNIFAVFAMLFGYGGGAVMAYASQAPDRADFLVTFKSKVEKSDEIALEKLGGKIKYSFDLVPVIAVNLPPQALQGIAHNPHVSTIEADGTFEAMDAELDNSWGVKRIGAGTTQTAGDNGRGVKVAILDTGIDYNHADLSANYAGGYDFVNSDSDPMDDNGHGTHVAGTIGALENNTGVVGVGPQISIYSLKVLNASGSGSFSNIIAALQWAVNNGMQVTSNSYGSASNPGTAVGNAFAAAETAGIFNAAAAGNSGTCLGRTDTVNYPAKYPSVVAVAATDSTDARACFSSTGSKVELSAPGVSINSTKIGGGYVTMSGTSMATPHVAGVAAVLFGHGVTDTNSNGRTNDEIRAVLDATAEDKGTTGLDILYGNGIVNVANAIASLSGGYTPPPVATTISVTGIAYSTTGGKNSDKNLITTVTLVNNLSAPVAGAVVRVTIRNTTTNGTWQSSGTTGLTGNIAFTLNNAPAGTYSTTVNSITLSGLVWDTRTPTNSYTK